MRDDPYLNGSDYFMLAFDHELRRHGFSGNSCQIVLELGAAISAQALQRRLDALPERFAILRASPGGFILPRWKLPRGAAPPAQVRVHRGEADAGARIFNEPLDGRRGELARFDLIERAGGRMDVVFKWSHALMDAPGAESFLAAVGREDLAWPAAAAAARDTVKLNFLERCKLSRKSLRQIDRFGRVAPCSPGGRHREAARVLRYRVEKFSAKETAGVRANGARHCGILGDAQYHAAVSAVELHRLHQRLGCASPSYVIPIPLGLRPKGTAEPLFGNQIAMLMLQFLPEHLDSVASAVATLKTQTQEALRGGLPESGRILGGLFRFLPLPVYMTALKQGLRGEICSLFYGDTANVNPLLTSFLGAPVTDFTHVAAVTPSPGVGVIFYYFHGELRLTVLHLLTALTEEEGAGFAAALRARLLAS